VNEYVLRKELANKRIHDKLAAMKTSDDLTYMANLYMALADRTRLRILNLLREGEVCVADFTEVLGHSQPKISRHLAYLRNAGIVETRRDGKWIHYCIAWPDDQSVRDVIKAALHSLSMREICAADTDRYTGSLSASSNGIGPVGNGFDDIYAETYMLNEADSDEETTHSSHNELDEFLL
jgi:ArsR family transcriptional regulator